MTSIDIGFTFTKTKEIYPKLKGIRPEEFKDRLASKGYTETTCRDTLFDGIVEAEFNYKNDSLYSFYFTYTETNFEKAKIIANEIRNFYSKKYGEPTAEKIEEENRFNKNYYWPLVNKSQPFINFNLNSNEITWGKKSENPL
jgi:hypothetical protein